MRHYKQEPNMYLPSDEAWCSSSADDAKRILLSRLLSRGSIQTRMEILNNTARSMDQLLRERHGPRALVAIDTMAVIRVARQEQACQDVVSFPHMRIVRGTRSRSKP